MNATIPKPASPAEIKANVARWRKEHSLNPPQRARITLPLKNFNNGIRLSDNKVVIDVSVEVSK